MNKLLSSIIAFILWIGFINVAYFWKIKDIVNCHACTIILYILNIFLITSYVGVFIFGQIIIKKEGRR